MAASHAPAVVVSQVYGGGGNAGSVYTHDFVELFNPEQREWKTMAHPAPVEPTDDPGRAARRLMTDDGFNIGVLYQGKRAPYARANGGAQTVEALECQFRL
jgi:hypothetical protein